MKILFALAVLMSAAFVTPASANCYEHCHTTSSGDTTCHVNCY